MSSASGKGNLYSCCMKEQRKNIPYEPEVEVLTSGEILPPLKEGLREEPETVGSNPEREAPAINLNVTEIKELAAKDPEMALMYIVNVQPVVEVSAKHPLEELVEEATEGLLTGAE